MKKISNYRWIVYIRKTKAIAPYFYWEAIPYKTKHFIIFLSQEYYRNIGSLKQNWQKFARLHKIKKWNFIKD